MPAQYAVIVGGFDLTMAADRNRGSAFFNRNQRDVVIVRIIMLGLNCTAVHVQLPIDNRLSRTAFWTQHKALQRVTDGLVELIFGGVLDRQKHQLLNLYSCSTKLASFRFWLRNSMRNSCSPSSRMDAAVRDANLA